MSEVAEFEFDDLACISKRVVGIVTLCVCRWEGRDKYVKSAVLVVWFQNNAVRKSTHTLRLRRGTDGPPL